MPKKKSSGHAPVNGIRMYYEIHGEGTLPLVLIHGGGSTIDSTFGEMLPLFSAHGKVIAVELQAHGRTTDRDAPESFEQDADDVAALLRFLEIDRANFLGFSNGGTTTLQIAIRHPQLVKKIVVTSANYRRDGMVAGFFEFMPNATLENMPAPLKEAYLAVTPDENGLRTMFEKDKQRMIEFKDIPDELLRSITAPALIIVGNNDVVTIEHSLKMSQVIPGAQLVVLPGLHGELLGELSAGKKSKHLPGMTAALVEDFLSE